MFKQLSVENWRDGDEVNEMFVRLTPEGRASLDGDDWARLFLSLDLSDRVPEDVRHLFAVARGAMLYGWFFYPLFKLGEEQLYRVVETAARARYRRAGGTASQPTFAQAIDYLSKQGVIEAADLPRWNAARNLRNLSSHPEDQSVIPPGAVFSTLKQVTHDIESLFPPDG